MSLKGSIGRPPIIGSFGENTAAATAAAAAAIEAASFVSFGGGDQNLAIGANAFADSVDSSNCVAIGNDAAASVTDGFDCTWIGVRAGQDATEGVGDTAVGFRAMQKATVARNNTALGDSAFFMNQGAAGVAIGYTAAEYMTNGSSGVFIGYGAARARLSAVRCVYIGDAAGEITSNYVNCVPATGEGGTAAGEDNVGIGTSAINECLGSRVVAVGSTAGGSLVGGVGDALESTFLGFYAGFNALQKVDAINSMALGAKAYTTKHNQVVLGNDQVAETILRGVTRHTTYTVATLPSASTMGAGARAFVTDANATTFASVVAGGGSNGVPVYSDGTNWRIG